MTLNRQWLLGMAALATAALVGCRGAAQVQPEATPAGEEPQAPAEQPPQPPAAPSENYGPAPEIVNDVWLNTDAPIRIGDQRGKVVLVEFWTFG